MEVWSQLARFCLDKILRSLPARVLKRIYTPLDLHRHIEIDLMSTTPVHVSLGDSPRLDLYLRVTNKSPYVDIEIDRVSVQLLDSQPFIEFESGQIEPVRKLESNNIYRHTYLNELQRIKLREVRDARRELDVSVEMSFNSPIGRINKSVDRITRFRTEFSG